MRQSCRCNDYVAAGADMIFAEALTDREQYQTFTNSVSAPILANMTEFGKTPIIGFEAVPRSRWRRHGPLSA